MHPLPRTGLIPCAQARCPPTLSVGTFGTGASAIERDVSQCRVLTLGQAIVLAFQAGQLKGKVSYMAPEQVRGEPICDPALPSFTPLRFVTLLGFMLSRLSS